MSRLAGARVVVTRSADKAVELCTLLEAEGATPIACPTIRIDAPASPEALVRAVERVADYDWLVFTSANAVAPVLSRVAGNRADLPVVACVGTATERALAGAGVGVAFVPADFSSRALAETLEPVEGRRVLYAKGDLASPTLGEVLRSRGARVDEVVAYRTVPQAPSGACLDELRRGVHALTFTSPSTVAGFVSMGPEWRSVARGAIVATIGPTTTAAAEEVGLEGPVEASEHTVQGLVDALAGALEARGRAGG